MNILQRVSYLLAVLVGCIVVPQSGLAYPEFISYGYSTCITCHYNGQGSGPLNDYGRALFSTEIASRAIFSSQSSEEEIAAKSGFLGSVEFPWWIRPGIKYRGLYFMNNPGSQAAVKRYVTMQADVNLAFQLDPDAKWLIVTSFGYQPTPAAKQNNKDENDKNMVMRERYARWQISRKFYFYMGLMDKVFGIRTPDHTAYSRAVVGVAQSDQSDGVIGQYYGDGWELTGQYFLGNMVQEERDIRLQGFTSMYEYDIGEQSRLGTSLMQAKNDYVEKTRFSMHSKLGLLKGNSILTEVGFVRDNPKANPNAKFGGYLMMQGVYLVSRGYNVISQIEYYNATMTPASPDMTKWTFGFLMFPMPRMELRTTFVNGRTIQDTSVSKDTWMLQTQLHLSL